MLPSKRAFIIYFFLQLFKIVFFKISNSFTNEKQVENQDIELYLNQGFKTKLFIIDESKRNNVYLLVHSPTKLDTSDHNTVSNKIFKFTSKKFEEYAKVDTGHFSIVIDIEGETKNNLNPIGIECHLINEHQSQQSQQQINLLIKKRIKNYSTTKKAILIGKLKIDNNNFNSLGQYINFFENSFQSFLNSKLPPQPTSNTKLLSSIDMDKPLQPQQLQPQQSQQPQPSNKDDTVVINCHTFSKYLIEDIMKLKWPNSINLVEENYPFLKNLITAQKNAEIIINNN